MIVYMREQTVNFTGKPDERVYKSAKEMLEIFDMFVATIKNGKQLRSLGDAVTGDFMPKVFQYMADFEDWYPMRKVGFTVPIHFHIFNSGEACFLTRRENPATDEV